MSVLHCMMMSHGGELLARYRGLLQSHHEYVQSVDSRLNDYEERVIGSKAKGKERKKKIKSLTKSLDNLHAEVACLSAPLMNNASGITMLPNNEIFEGMGHMGYPTDGSFTFWKSFFTPQWRFLVHHILHCISSKSGGWDQFGSNIATALRGVPRPLLPAMLSIVDPSVGQEAPSVTQPQPSSSVVPPTPPTTQYLLKP
ncbi:hypothetical protein Tco_0683595 [Tanacetum coccineum]